MSVDSNYGMFSKRGKMGTLHTKQQKQLFSVPLLTFSVGKLAGMFAFLPLPRARQSSQGQLFGVPITFLGRLEVEVEWALVSGQIAFLPCVYFCEKLWFMN